MQATKFNSAAVLLKKIVEFEKTTIDEGTGVVTETKIKQTFSATFDLTATVVITREMVDRARELRDDDLGDYQYELKQAVNSEAIKIISDRHGFGISDKSEWNFADGYWEYRVEQGEFEGFVIGVGYSFGLPDDLDFDTDLVGTPCFVEAKSFDSEWGYTRVKENAKRARWMGEPLPSGVTSFQIVADV